MMFLYIFLKEIFICKKSSLDLPKIIIPTKAVLSAIGIKKTLLDHWIIQDHHYTIKSQLYCFL